MASAAAAASATRRKTRWVMGTLQGCGARARGRQDLLLEVVRKCLPPCGLHCFWC